MYGYNNYGQMPNIPQYNPYAQGYAGGRNQNILPAQQVIQVNGKASADNIQLAPNSSIIVADKNAPVIYMCVSDGLGQVTATAYDIMPHQDKPPVDVNRLEDRITKIENYIAGMEEKANGKSNVKQAKSKQNDAEPCTD